MSMRSWRQPIKSSIAVGFVLLLWIAYTILQTLSVVELVGTATSAILGFVPGILGVTVLLTAGLSRQDCFLQFGRLSWRGFAVLAATAVFALAAIIPVGEWQGWNWTAALLYAPAAGVAQELFFRSALLPAVQLVLGRPTRVTLVGHSLLFGLWHIGPLFVGAPIWAVLAVMLVPFICGLGWGWQVQRDRTVFWAMVQHSLIWVIGLQFPPSG
ncbi:MAG: CPBP family intramembrane metalloprotease [Anaerolineae bacterium]|jgi:membrane protease YdiL (CAAX protease family)